MIDALRKVVKRLHYPLDVMLTCVRWYAAYPLSLRHIEELMAERGLCVDHATVHHGGGSARRGDTDVMVAPRSRRTQRQRTGTGRVVCHGKNTAVLSLPVRSPGRMGEV